MFSKFGQLNLEDFVKGAIVAVLASVLPVIESVIMSGSLVFDWKAMGTLALGSFIAYITKNLFTSSTGTPFSKEHK